MTVEARSVSQVERQVLKRLGGQGLAQVLGDLLEQPKLVRLANACGLRYPGMRTQSQKRERIVSDLAERAEAEEPARRAIFRTLVKETSAAAREWARLDAKEKARRLEDDTSLAANGKLGLQLFLVASSKDEGSDETLAALLRRTEPRNQTENQPEEIEGANSREAARLKKKSAELQKKLQHLEVQLARARETERLLKREVLQRKGELAESRMLVERLRREQQEAAAEPTPPAIASPAQAAASAAPDAAVTEVSNAVRKLAAEQRKLAHSLGKLAGASPSPAALSPDALAPVLEAIEEVKKESQARHRELKKEDERLGRRLDELLTEARAARAAAQETPASARPARRRKGEVERVGVFIDVQNMYYAARQLRGKLDFDALLHAVVRDRRLIEAKAYVVETQEIDQSGFIAMLQQRAIEVRRKTLKVRSDGSMKGDWDMEMALDILDAAPRLDVVVLVSGDGDFTSLVNRLKGMGPRVEVVAFPRNTAKSLLEAADEFQPLDRKFIIRSEAASSREPRSGGGTRSSASAPGSERARPLSPEPVEAGPRDEGAAPAGAQK